MAQGPGRITLWGIEVFVALAEEGSVSGAARRLGASVSAVSQQITNLERSLGTQLFDRTARPVAPSPAGTLFLRRAQAILNEAAQARAELAARDLALLTRLRLGLIEDFDADVTPRLLIEMAAELTDCHFLLETGASHRLLEKLEARQLDVIVAAEAGPAADWAEVHPLLCEPFVVAAPRERFQPGPGLRDALPRLPFIHYTSRHMMGRLIDEHLGRHNLALPRRFELDSYHAIMAMVAAGTGWTIITPLGCMAAERFRDAVDIFELPFAPVSRRIVLSARREVLDAMPARIAERLRRLLGEHVVPRARARMPFLGKSLAVLPGPVPQVP